MNRFALSALALSAIFGAINCSGTTQTIGDAPGGAAGTPGSAGANSVAGAGAGAGTGGDAGAVSACDENEQLVTSKDQSVQLCAHRCNSDEQSEWGEACDNGLSGDAGTCYPFLRWIIEGPFAGGLSGTGICTRGCDPLAQDCPTGYSCDVTDAKAAGEPGATFACLPEFANGTIAAGDPCAGTPEGYCGVGLTCVPEGDTYTCRAFCDLTASDPCPSGKSCTALDIYEFVSETNAGICQ